MGVETAGSGDGEPAPVPARWSSRRRRTPCLLSAQLTEPDSSRCRSSPATPPRRLSSCIRRILGSSRSAARCISSYRGGVPDGREGRCAAVARALVRRSSGSRFISCRGGVRASVVPGFVSAVARADGDRAGRHSAADAALVADSLPVRGLVPEEVARLRAPCSRGEEERSRGDHARAVQRLGQKLVLAAVCE